MHCRRTSGTASGRNDQLALAVADKAAINVATINYDDDEIDNQLRRLAAAPRAPGK